MEEKTDVPPFEEFARDTRNLERQSIDVKRAKRALKFEKDDSLDTEPKEFTDKSFENAVGEVRRVEKIIAASWYDSSLGGQQSPIAQEPVPEQQAAEASSPAPIAAQEEQQIVFKKQAEEKPIGGEETSQPRRRPVLGESQTSMMSMPEPVESEQSAPLPVAKTEGSEQKGPEKKKKSPVFQFDIDISEETSTKRKKK